VWSGFLAGAGYLLGQQFERIEDVIGPVSSAIIAAIIIFYIYRQITWTRRNSKRADGRSGTHP
jgi:membrane protein DedA with SNARE-associated domain